MPDKTAGQKKTQTAPQEKRQDILYIKGDRDVEISKRSVTLNDILTMECSDRQMLDNIKKLRLFQVKKGGRQRYVVSVLKIISLIHEKYPEVIVHNLGETDIIVTYEEKKKNGKFVHVAKAAFVAVVTFFGAAFSIMAFNNDVDVTRLFGQVYGLVTGRGTDGFTVLEISYSIGITIGILVFFNHFGKKRFTVDPTPMEVQMRLYENDIQTTLIEDSARKGDEIDVDGSTMGGTAASGSDRS